MSHQILTRGDVVTAFRYGPGDSRAECSCGFDGPSRMRVSRARLDALLHASRSGCQPDQPLTCRVKRRSLWERLTPPWVIAGFPLVIIPVVLFVGPVTR